MFSDLLARYPKWLNIFSKAIQSTNLQACRLKGMPNNSLITPAKDIPSKMHCTSCKPAQWCEYSCPTSSIFLLTISLHIRAVWPHHATPFYPWWACKPYLVRIAITRPTSLLTSLLICRPLQCSNMTKPQKWSMNQVQVTTSKWRQQMVLWTLDFELQAMCNAKSVGITSRLWSISSCTRLPVLLLKGFAVLRIPLCGKIGFPVV